MKSYNIILFSLIMTALGSLTVQAEELTGTLKKIKDNGLIIVGHRESSIPFSYYGNNQEVVGYSQDYVSIIIEAIKTKLEMPSLRVKLLPITSQTRIPLLQNGTYDIECGSTTNNTSRQAQVDFSNNLFIIGTRLLIKKKSAINSIDDLKGKNITTTAGTTSEVRLNQINDANKMQMRIISTKDHSGAFRTLESGRALAFLMDDALLAGERAKAKKPDDWIIVGDPLSYEAYGCMLRKGDYQFKSLVDGAIASTQLSGEAVKLYDRWFTQPIPPSGLNLHFELSDEMKELFASPNDKALS